jgi:hypothetical protein
VIKPERYGHPFRISGNMGMEPGARTKCGIEFLRDCNGLFVGCCCFMITKPLALSRVLKASGQLKPERLRLTGNI